MTRQVFTIARATALAIGLVFIASASAMAQSTGTVRGRITDASAQPVQDVNVKGVFFCTKHVVQSVIARRIGFSRQTRQVQVPAGGEVTSDFQLAPAATSLEQVVVTGTAGSVASRRARHPDRWLGRVGQRADGERATLRGATAPCQLTTNLSRKIWQKIVMIHGSRNTLMSSE